MFINYLQKYLILVMFLSFPSIFIYVQAHDVASIVITKSQDGDYFWVDYRVNGTTDPVDLSSLTFEFVDGREPLRLSELNGLRLAVENITTNKCFEIYTLQNESISSACSSDSEKIPYQWNDPFWRGSFRVTYEGVSADCVTSLRCELQGISTQHEPTPTAIPTSTPCPYYDGMLKLMPDDCSILIDANPVSHSDMLNLGLDELTWDGRVVTDEISPNGYALSDAVLSIPEILTGSTPYAGNISWLLADAYCKSVEGRRLPTLEEIEIAYGLYGENEFYSSDELIEWTSTPYLHDLNDPSKPNFYYIWLTQDFLEDQLMEMFRDKDVQDDSVYYFPIYSPFPIIENIAFRCVLEM